MVKEPFSVRWVSGEPPAPCTAIVPAAATLGAPLTTYVTPLASNLKSVSVSVASRASDTTFCAGVAVPVTFPVTVIWPPNELSRSMWTGSSIVTVSGRSASPRDDVAASATPYAAIARSIISSTTNDASALDTSLAPTAFFNPAGPPQDVIVKSPAISGRRVLPESA